MIIIVCLDIFHICICICVGASAISDKPTPGTGMLLLFLTSVEIPLGPGLHQPRYCSQTTLMCPNTEQNKCSSTSRSERRAHKTHDTKYIWQRQHSSPYSRSPFNPIRYRLSCSFHSDSSSISNLHINIHPNPMPTICNRSLLNVDLITLFALRSIGVSLNSTASRVLLSFHFLQIELPYPE